MAKVSFVVGYSEFVRLCVLSMQARMSAFGGNNVKQRRSGRHDRGEYEKQRQPAEHDKLLNAAGIEFARHFDVPFNRAHGNSCRS
jgi:hypothetical protein